MRTLTLQVFTLDELEDKVRDRIVQREYEDAWNGWAHYEAAELMHEYATRALPGTDNLKVPAWSLHYYPGAVVECDVVDAARFADALGCTIPEDAYVSVVPHYANGSWVGESSVVVTTTDAEGWSEDQDHAELSRALQDAAMQVVRDVAEEMDARTSEEAITESLLEAGWLYLADGTVVGSLDD